MEVGVNDGSTLALVFLLNVALSKVIHFAVALALIRLLSVARALSGLLGDRVRASWLFRRRLCRLSVSAFLVCSALRSSLSVSFARASMDSVILVSRQTQKAAGG